MPVSATLPASGEMPRATRSGGAGLAPRLKASPWTPSMANPAMVATIAGAATPSFRACPMPRRRSILVVFMARASDYLSCSLLSIAVRFRLPIVKLRVQPSLLPNHLQAKLDFPRVIPGLCEDACAARYVSLLVKNEPVKCIEKLHSELNVEVLRNPPHGSIFEEPPVVVGKPGSDQGIAPESADRARRGKSTAREVDITIDIAGGRITTPWAKDEIGAFAEVRTTSAGLSQGAIRSKDRAKWCPSCEGSDSGDFPPSQRPATRALPGYRCGNSPYSVNYSPVADVKVRKAAIKRRVKDREGIADCIAKFIGAERC